MIPERDPQASEPFTQEELDTVFRGCQNDPSPWANPSAQFLAYTGAHITVLSGGLRQTTDVDEENDVRLMTWVYCDPIRSDAIRNGFIYWRRPKNEQGVGMPLKKELIPWLGEWLDKPRPGSSRRYQQVFDRVGRTIGLQINPLRFRHTCGVMLYELYDHDAKVVAKLLGCSEHVLITYIMNPLYKLGEKARLKGW